MTYQEMILALHKFWQDKGCIISTSYDSEIGAGTFNPLTFFGVLGKEPWRIAFVQISKRPKDGRYAENPVRLQQFFQYQVVLKPPPFDVQDIYLNSIEGLGINLGKHDVRFVEDDWKSETLGASGLGWEVWLDGMEITQFTYFQVIGGKELNPISCELTYGLGRIAMLIQEKDSLFDIEWGKGVKYGNIYREREYQFSEFNFNYADVQLNLLLFKKFEEEAKRLLDLELLYPGYDYVIKCSHILNILDARRAISPEERKNYISRVRRLSGLAATLYLSKIKYQISKIKNT